MKHRIWQEDARTGLTRPRTEDELWARICQVWDDIPRHLLINIRRSYRANRIDKLIAAQGDRFENEKF